MGEDSCDNGREGCHDGRFAVIGAATDEGEICSKRNGHGANSPALHTARRRAQRQIKVLPGPITFKGKNR
jgi:hypothetical protein